MTTVIELLDLDSITSVSGRFPLTEGDDFRFFIHAPGYDGIIADIFVNEPVVTDYYNSIHGEYDAAAVVAIRNGKESFQRIVDRLDITVEEFNKDDLMEMLAEFKTETGVDFVEDILASIGGHMGFGIVFDGSTDVQMYNPFSLFSALGYEFQIGLDNQQAMLDAIQTIDAQNEGNSPMTFMEHRGGTIMAPDTGGYFDVSLGMLNGRMYFGMYSPDKMKQTFDGVLDGPSMAAVFSQAMDAIPADSFVGTITSNDYFKKYAGISKKMYMPGMENMPETYRLQIDGLIESMEAQPPMISYYQVRDGGAYAVSDFSIRNFLRIMLIEVIKAKAMMETELLEEEPEEAVEEAYDPAA